MADAKATRHPLDKGDGRFVTNPKIQDAGYFKKFCHEEGGDQTTAIIQLQPGGGNPLHYHNTFIESFTANKGVLSLEIGNGNIKRLQPGESASVPLTVIHRFFNESDEMIEFTTTLDPGSRGFEQSIYIVYGLAAEGLTDDKGVPKSFLHLCVFATLGDINLAGVAGYLMNPVMSAAYAYAKWTGVEKELIEKYCPPELR